MNETQEWMLDVTFGTEPLPCFVPYDADNDAIIFGISMLTERCPGKLVGVCSQDGVEAVEAWCEKNLDWRERYSRDAAVGKE